ncbi:MAG: phosphoribosylanthranilate isomerase [Acidobacteria bacterium]|nr:phosphoribosylanthranilate isomerase [Acidobacteriaceae bacterium]MBV9609696.1 phosphoribosylanthranilate isomerase [Acidobacteriota bacterium]
MWVKICGTTNLEDARLAVDAGADALGFIFAPSPRRIHPKEAAGIIAELPSTVEKVGVFVNQSPAIILDTADTARLTGVQLHGDEDQPYIQNLANVNANRTRSLDIFKAIAFQRAANDDVDSFAEFADHLRALVIDSGSASKAGGTGNPFDWPAARLLVNRFSRTFDVVIAGGLTPSNVGEAIQLFDPWGVDVVSGVERSPGKKDPQKVREFIAAARKSAVSASSKSQ